MTRLRSIRAATLAGALVAMTAAAAAAQGPDATAQRIFRLGMDSSWAQKLAQTLFDSIGPRLTASPGHHAAGDWVVKMYKSWGIDVKKENYGTWRGWKRSCRKSSTSRSPGPRCR